MGYWPRIQKQSIIGLIYHISYTHIHMYIYIHIHTYIYIEREREKKKNLLMCVGSIRDLGQAGFRDVFIMSGIRLGQGYCWHWCRTCRPRRRCLRRHWSRAHRHRCRCLRRDDLRPLFHQRWWIRPVVLFVVQNHHRWLHAPPS